MKKIYNGTPHSINMVIGANFNPSIRKHVGGEVVFSIPPDGMLNATMQSQVMPEINGIIPVFDKSIIGLDPLPDGYDVYIVSALYVSAAKKAGMDMTKLYTVHDPVYTEDGNSFIGCRGICPAF